MNEKMPGRFILLAPLFMADQRTVTAQEVEANSIKKSERNTMLSTAFMVLALIDLAVTVSPIFSTQQVLDF